MISQGVRQEPIISLHLYNFYPKDLLHEINTTNIGTTVNGVYTGNNCLRRRPHFYVS